ncbi:MAG TPA: PIG-L family deacetylase, partial [Terriglobales bacterium]|nr:PIG-L family deacetylase [Terriglobales bacterium]
RTSCAVTLPSVDRVGESDTLILAALDILLGRSNKSQLRYAARNLHLFTYSMTSTRPPSSLHTFSLFSALALAVLLIALQIPAGAEKPVLAQDQGFVALQQELQRLRTTARLMHTTAHPDDEDGGMLTLESRGKGTTALLCSLTRGQGGQNKSGDAFSDELGVLRTLELLAATQYYGVDLRFTRVADFGFSKTPEETFQKWGGHDIVVGDLVRVIRTFRPDVLAARFTGTSRDGHAHHQASSIVTQEAFKAAGDPNRFPEQIKEGLLPWQPKKLYIGHFGSSDDANVKFDIGTYSPLLGMSYTQLAVEGLAHQTSQGTGGFRVPPGHRFTYYTRVDSILPKGELKENESDFFEGIDTSLPALAARLGSDESKVPFLLPTLKQMANLVEEAAQKANPRNTTDAGASLIEGLKLTRDVIRQVEQSSLTAAAKLELLTNLSTKEAQFERAANLALGVLLEVAVDPPTGSQSGFFRLEQTFQTAAPGQTFTLTARFYDRGTEDVEPEQIVLDMPEGFKSEILKRDLKPLHSGDMGSVQFRVTIPSEAQYTKPYWGRKNAYTETFDTFSNLAYATLPLPPWPVQAHAIYTVVEGKGTAHAVVMAKYVDPVSGQGQHELPVAPALSLEFGNASQVVRAESGQAFPVNVRVRSQLTTAANATLHLAVPAGWSVNPPSRPIHLEHEGDIAELQFAVSPKANGEKHYDLAAIADYEGKQLKEGFHVVTRPDLDTFYYYRPAKLDVSAVRVNVPSGLRVGYIMGAGDEIAATLKQLGIDVEMIPPSALATTDLSRFHTVVTRIRAYDVSTEVRAQNPKLLDFVSRGGTLLVQYNSNVNAFNSGHYPPYSASDTTQRVSVEEAPVEILEAENPILKTPNNIDARDFAGWVQERGLYFMGDWDQHFHPLLSSHDPGEQPLKGGLLVTQYGKGTYIYTGYAFFRQLPAGVPGAIRLFVNLLSAGSGAGR